MSGLPETPCASADTPRRTSRPGSVRRLPPTQGRHDERRINRALAVHRAADRSGKRLGRRVLEHVPDGAGLEGPVKVAWATEGRENDHADIRATLVQRCGGPEAIAPGQLDVKERHVRPDALGGVDELVAARDGGDHVDVCLHGEQCAECVTHHGLILGEKHADHAGAARAAVLMTHPLRGLPLDLLESAGLSVLRGHARCPLLGTATRRVADINVGARP